MTTATLKSIAFTFASYCIDMREALKESDPKMSSNYDWMVTVASGYMRNPSLLTKENVASLERRVKRLDAIRWGVAA